MNLRLDWCQHNAAEYAVKHWHYSKSLPTPPLVKVGVWEENIYIGCVLFSRGANKDLGTPYNLGQTEVCELTRIALNTHKTPVSRIVKLALKFLKKHCPGLKLVISYADPKQGHLGGVYQAGNWIYEGVTSSSYKWLAPDGKEWHPRMISPSGKKKVYGQYIQVWKPEQCQRIDCEGKHKYLMPLDDEIRLRIQPLSKPYPKRPKEHEPDTLGSSGRCDSDPDAPTFNQP